MQAWVGLFRPSARTPAPSWVFGAELFTNLDHARTTFEARAHGRRPKPPPLIVRWTYFGTPDVLPMTQHWVTPDVDRSATLRLVPYAALTLAALQSGDVEYDLTVKLNRWGNSIIIKTEDQS